MDYGKSFSHFPLKKRPIHLVEEEDEPQDLSFKRPKLEIPEQKINSTIPLNKDVPCDQSAGIPHLADFYLKLFQSSNLESQSLQQHENCYDLLRRTVMPTYFYEKSKAVPQKNLYPNSYSSNPEPYNAISPPAVARSPLQTLTDSKIANIEVVDHHVSTNNIPIKMPLIRPILSDESEMSSPRSISSEDSGVGLSEEEESDISENINKYLCNNCGKSYSTFSGISRHKQIHCMSVCPKEYSCKHCNKMYTTVGALKMHIRTHTLPCKCHLCGKAFSRPWLLQGHIRTHTGEKPFECPQCERSFADRSNLRAHLQTHAHIKKYACKNCTKTFSRMSLLNKHNETSCPRTNVQ